MSAKDCILTQDRLKELLRYNPKTGVFTWRVHRGGRAMKGSVAGWGHNQGYLAICVDFKRYLAHRLAFLYMTGSMPEEVDHDNGVRSDNRWTNLNPSSSQDNSRNQKLMPTNTSGVCGVSWHKRGQKWESGISVRGARKYLGLFTNFEDAVKARRKAEKKYGFHPNHGKKQSEREAL